ncbi:MAG: hypothetical protein NC517_08105 [Firmicutes bacterium]|nr:hypothetical protein [Bacillota bacterium]
MKRMIGIFILLFTCGLTGCGRNAQTSDLKIVPCEAVDIAEDDFYTAAFSDNVISVKPVGSEQAKLEIPIAYDAYQVYIDMFDGDHGSILYCSSPAAGQMNKLLYYTESGWDSYTEKDISSQIDGYPGSLTMSSPREGYIGVELRSDAYLYRTDDAGQTWTPFTVDDQVENCNGYAPVFSGEKACLLLDMKSSDKYVFRLYCSEDGGKNWKIGGEFSMDEKIESYFIKDEIIYIVDEKGDHWFIE